MIAKRLIEKCTECNICKDIVNCPLGNAKSIAGTDKCIGCGICTLSCPEEAIVLQESHKEKIKVYVNEKEVMACGTVKNVLVSSNIKLSKYPDFKNEDEIFMPCKCGGCWTCLALVNGRFAPLCITPLREGMKIDTQTRRDEYPSLRVVSSFGVHTVGGVGTPYNLKSIRGPIEVVGFTHGCNLRCPQCQNFPIALTSGGNLLEAYEASKILLGLKELHRLDRIAISGGESTLNRKWLVNVIKSIRNQDENVKIHVDTNGTILSHDYIDELVKCGMTDIGIDLKSLNVSTYMNITCLNDKKLAEKYLETSWSAIKYIIDNYFEDIFLGIGIPYNSALISKDEIEEIGKKIFYLNPDVQVCVLDYRPEFRRKNLIRPSTSEMIHIKDLLNSAGLNTVIVQTSEGHFGP